MKNYEKILPNNNLCKTATFKNSTYFENYVNYKYLKNSDPRYKHLLYYTRTTYSAMSKSESEFPPIFLLHNFKVCPTAFLWQLFYYIVNNSV